MIEIVLALVILSITQIGVMGLLSVGIDQNNKSISKSCVSDAAEQFLYFNACKIKQNWNWKDAFPLDNKYTGDDTQLTWSSTSVNDNPNIKIYFPINEGEDPDIEFEGV